MRWPKAWRPDPSPLIHEVDGKKQMLTRGGADRITGHDAETGKRLWRRGHLERGEDRPLAHGR